MTATYNIITVKKMNNVVCIKFLQSGRTFLHEAAISQWENAQVVERIAKAGADLNISDKVS